MTNETKVDGAQWDLNPEFVRVGMDSIRARHNHMAVGLVLVDDALEECGQVLKAYESTRNERNAMRRDREEAAGELMVNIEDAQPGTVAGKLLCANAIMRRERDALRERVRELATALDRLVECHVSMSGCTDYGEPWDADEDVDIIAARAALLKAGIL